MSDSRPTRDPAAGEAAQQPRAATSPSETPLPDDRREPVMSPPVPGPGAGSAPPPNPAGTRPEAGTAETAPAEGTGRTQPRQPPPSKPVPDKKKESRRVTWIAVAAVVLALVSLYACSQG
ncbi:hypothetical protein D1122_04005 [Cereibacter sphaeroides]|nr:hypothetical protein D1122_04005 [Cereibacter sphaeroides]